LLPKNFLDLFSLVAHFFSHCLNRLGWNGELGVEDQKRVLDGWMMGQEIHACMTMFGCDEETILYLVLMVRCVDLTLT